MRYQSILLLLAVYISPLLAAPLPEDIHPVTAPTVIDGLNDNSSPTSNGSLSPQTEQKQEVSPDIFTTKDEPNTDMDNTSMWQLAKENKSPSVLAPHILSSRSAEPSWRFFIPISPKRLPMKLRTPEMQGYAHAERMREARRMGKDDSKHRKALEKLWAKHPEWNV